MSSPVVDNPLPRIKKYLAEEHWHQAFHVRIVETLHSVDLTLLSEDQQAVYVELSVSTVNKLTITTNRPVVKGDPTRSMAAFSRVSGVAASLLQISEIPSV